MVSLTLFYRFGVFPSILVSTPSHCKIVAYDIEFTVRYWDSPLQRALFMISIHYMHNYLGYKRMARYFKIKNNDLSVICAFKMVSIH